MANKDRRGEKSHKRGDGGSVSAKSAGKEGGGKSQKKDDPKGGKKS